jgi:hypothetical protein
VHASAVSDRQLAVLRIPKARQIADCTVAKARRFGITLEIDADDDYELCQHWAAAFAGAGFEGVRYRLRHDPRGKLLGIALFGGAGVAEWPVDRSEGIPDELLRAAEKRFGVIVVPGLMRYTPSKRRLDTGGYSQPSPSWSPSRRWGSEPTT